MTGRRRTGVGLVVGVAVAALAVCAVVAATRGDDRAQRVSTEPPIRIGAEPAAGPALTQAEAEQVVRTLLDPTGDQLASAATIDADDAAELLVDIRRAAATAGVTSTEVVQVGIEAAEGDHASVDARISTSGTTPAGTGGVHLRHITVVRSGGTWRITREAACGIASGGGMLATPTSCIAPPQVHRVPSLADPLDLMGDLPGDRLDAQWDRFEADPYGSELVSGPAGLVAVEYPGIDVGGGGPSGPVELVRLDPGSGRELARMRPGGDYATVVVGTEAVWVLASAPVNPSGGGGWGHFLLTRVDAGTFRSTGTMAIDAEDGALLAVTGDTAWVHHPGGLQRIEGPEPHVTATVAGVAGTVGDDESLAATPDHVVIPRSSAPDLVVDADSLAVREVDLPDGQVVASGSNLWVGNGSVQRLDPEAPLAEQDPPIEVPFGGQVTADGRGGVWLTGEIVAGWSDQTWNENALQVTAVRRPVAVHVGGSGRVDSTVVAAGPASSGYGLRFAAAGPLAALFGAGTVEIYEPH